MEAPAFLMLLAVMRDGQLTPPCMAIGLMLLCVCLPHATRRLDASNSDYQRVLRRCLSWRGEARQVIAVPLAMYAAHLYGMLPLNTIEGLRVMVGEMLRVRINHMLQ